MLHLWRCVAALLLGACAMAAQAQALKPFEPASLEQIVASHRGQPFVLLVWSMDCAFCQSSLDVLSKARAADPTLNIVTVTTDPVADTVLAGKPAIIPSISGRAWISGTRIEMLDPADPWPAGYRLSDTWPRISP